MMQDLPDRELLKRYATSVDEAAFRVVVERHLELVYQCAYRRLLDAQLSEDVAQQVFGLLARKAGRLWQHPALLAWLHQTTRFVAARQARSEQRQASKINALAKHMTVEGHSPDAWTLEKRSLLDEALEACLRDQERHVLLMHFVEGRSYKEIGAQLGKSEAASRTQASRALAKVADWFKQRGHSVSAVVVGGGLTQPWAPRASADLVREIVLSVSTATSQSFGMAIGSTLLLEPARVASLISLAVMSATLLGFVWENYQSNSAVSGPPSAIRARELPYLTLTRKRAINSEMLAVLQSDPEKLTAEQLVRSSLESMWTGRVEHEASVSLLGRLSQKSLLRLLEEVEALPISKTLKGGAVSSLLNALCRSNPRLACELSLEGKGTLFATFLWWLETSPVDAADWLAQQDERGRIDQLDLRAGPVSREFLICEAAAALIPIDRDRAFEFLQRFDSRRRDGMLWKLGLALIENGTPPLQAFSELQQELAEATPASLAESMAKGLADHSRRDDAVLIINSVYGNQPKKHVAAMVEIVQSLVERRGGFRQEADWLLDTIPEEALPEAAEELTSRFAGQGDEIASWMASLPKNSRLRDHAFLGVVRRLSSRNPDQARSALTQILNAEIRKRAEVLLDHGLDQIQLRHPDWDLSDIQLSLEP